MGRCWSQQDVLVDLKVPQKGNRGTQEMYKHQQRSTRTDRESSLGATSAVAISSQDLCRLSEDTARFRLTEKIAYDFIWKYMEDLTAVAQDSSTWAWKRHWDNNHASDYLLIRPSGNPLNMAGVIAMFETGVLTDFSDTIVAVESLKILAEGQVAVMVFKSDQAFKYKGNLEEDLATWTAVLVADEECQKARITNIQRSTGKKIDQVFSGQGNTPPTPAF